MNTIGDAEQFALKGLERGRLAWMALMLTPGMGPTRIAKAMMKLESAERLFEASLTELEATGMPAKAAQFVADGRARAAAEDEVKRVAEAGGWFLTREDEGYPERLLEIYDPPAVLWGRGSLELLGRRSPVRPWQTASRRPPVSATASGAPAAAASRATSPNGS